MRNGGRAHYQFSQSEEGGEKRMRALNQSEKALFDFICSGLPANVALVSTACNGVETACLCWVERVGEEYQMIPWAVLVNDEIFAMLKAP
jgi:hypothetical protein